MDAPHRADECPDLGAEVVILEARNRKLEKAQPVDTESDNGPRRASRARRCQRELLRGAATGELSPAALNIRPPAVLECTYVGPPQATVNMRPCGLRVLC